MTSENINTPNVSLQAVLLTMIIEKIDNLANRVADIQLHSSASQKSFDTLQTRIAALEEKSDKILLQQSNAIFGQNNIAKHKDGSGYSVQDAYYEPVVKIDVVTHVESEQVLFKESVKPAAATLEAKNDNGEKPKGFSDKFNKKEGEWDCQICYVRNKPVDDACVSCGTGKDGKEKTTSAANFKATTFASPANSSFSFGINNTGQKPLFGIPQATPAAPIPAKTEVQTTESKPAETKNLFGSTKPITFSFAPTQAAATTSPFAQQSNASPFGAKSDGTQPKSLFGSTSSIANKTPMSCSSFAKGNTFLDKAKSDSPNTSFGAQKSSTCGQNDVQGSENPEEYVPDVHYEPVVPLPDKVDVVTGEESEQVLFKNRCKLYIFNSETKEVKERGVGDIKVLFNPEKKSYRVVMRRDQVHKICANFRITKEMSIGDKTGTANCGIFSCVDFSDNNEAGAPTIYVVRFKEENVYEEFKKMFTNNAEGKQTEGGLSGQSVPKETKDDACVSGGTGKDDKEKTTPAANFKSTTFASPANSSFSFGINNTGQKPLFGIPQATPAAPIPAKTEVNATESKPADTKSLFGSTKPITFSFAPTQAAATTSPFAQQSNASPFGARSDGTQPKSLFGGSTSSIANKTPMSFSSFASGTNFLEKKSDSPNNSFGAQKSSTFTQKDNTQQEEGSENPEEYVPDVHYEPVVPLPDKVDVVTGEESEQVLFKNRCKLYIFNSETKEVKERGVGDIKVLFNPEKKSYRVVMRREQVHKICANFRITKGMSIGDKTGTTNCGIFSCMDFSENPQEGKSTVFYVRFREENVYEEFKKLFNDIADGTHTIHTDVAETTASVLTSKSPSRTATVPSLPFDPYSDANEVDEEEEYDEDYGEEENYDEESEVLLESNCKVTLGEAYKSPLSKNQKSDEIYENVKLIVSVADEGVYKVEFDNGKDKTIFPHFIQNDSDYKKDGKKISFFAGDHNAVRKSVTCEFKDVATAQTAFKTLKQCCLFSVFDGYDN